MIRKEGHGYRLYSTSKPGRALGPVRLSKEEVGRKDEKRVQFFKNLGHSKGGPGSLKAKFPKKSLLN